MSGIVAASVEWLRQTLPSHAWLGYVGIMRDERVLATISGLSADEIPDLLLALGWPGSPATLDHGLAAGRRLAGGITVALDIIDLGGDTTIGLLVRGRLSSRPRSGSALLARRDLHRARPAGGSRFTHRPAHQSCETGAGRRRTTDHEGVYLYCGLLVQSALSR
ncbi:MAG TPA: hypothetical protein VMU34_20015 [Mycobacterium sp.]|nr:hypothetical protein [Mycobacterium sp.]